MIIVTTTSGPARAGSGGGGENPPPPKQNTLAKNLYTKSAIISLNCRVTSASSEMVNLYSSQMMILPGKTETCATQSGHEHPYEPPGPDNLYQLLHHLSSALYQMTLRVKNFSYESNRNAACLSKPSARQLHGFGQNVLESLQQTADQSVQMKTTCAEM
jgi:hypothetical protein